MSDQRTEVECEAIRVPNIVPCWGSDLVALVVDLVEVLFHWLCFNMHLCIYLGWGLLQYTCGGQRAACLPLLQVPSFQGLKWGPWICERQAPYPWNHLNSLVNIYYYCFCFWDKISYNQAVFELAEYDFGFQMKNFFWSSCLCCDCTPDLWVLETKPRVSCMPGKHSSTEPQPQLPVLACVKMGCYIIFNQWRNALVF